VKKSEKFILCINVTVDSPNATFITGPNSAQFTLKRETAVSHGIWQTVPRNVKICCGKLWALVIIAQMYFGGDENS